jgi:FtsP/CotA-like multicopper oxidase with cupredoxin domain
MDLHESEEDSEVIGVDLRENINGVKFPKPVDGVVAPAFDMKYDAVQSWNLNGVKDHPGHLHVQHMQLQDVYNWDEVPDWFETGEWVDTVALDGTPTVKFRTDRFGGDYFFHCHVSAPT